jgi:hypothetical protein
MHKLSRASWIQLFLIFIAATSSVCNAQPRPLDSAPWVGSNLSGAPCKGRGQGFGPFDYTVRTDANIKALNLVHGGHFPPETERLTHRNAHLGLNYTLSAWPNHHRALYSAINYRMKRGQPYYNEEFAPVECWFQRAINFSPKDGTTHMLYGMYLHKLDFRSEALEEYRIAEKLSPSDLNLKYNLALLLIELEKYAEAKKYAKHLYNEGFPLPGLRNKLVEAGYWK